MLVPRVAQLSLRMRLVHYAACELRSHYAGVLSSVWPQSFSSLDTCQSRHFVNFKKILNLENKIVKKKPWIFYIFLILFPAAFHTVSFLSLKILFSLGTI